MLASLKVQIQAHRTVFLLMSAYMHLHVDKHDVYRLALPRPMVFPETSSVAKNAAMTCWQCYMQVKLLQFVRPQDFDNFRHFVRWRDTTANILLQILQKAAQQPASDDDR